MKLRPAIAVAVLQVGVLAFMAGQREWISRFGEQITLRTAPIDPDDPMRGAYVRLDYEISRVPSALCRGAVLEWTKIADYRLEQQLRDRIVYAALEVDQHGIANLAALSDERPATGPFIRGRFLWADANGVHVRYGIEALFMHKEAALRTERIALDEKIGAPMNVHVALGSSGIAVLKDYEWEPLGVTLEFDPLPPRQTEEGQAGASDQPRLTGLTVTLHNYGDVPLAVVDLRNGRSFRLLQNNRWQPGGYEWPAHPERDIPVPRPDEVILLQPGEIHSSHIDLTDRRWWVTDTANPGSPPIPMQEIENGWRASFRIEYAPPPAERLQGLENADLVRHTALRSRAFNANRGID